MPRKSCLPVSFSPVSLLGAVMLAGCAAPGPREPIGPPAKEEIVAVTVSNHLLRFNAGQPQRVLARQPLQGLPAGETLVGIDYRVARGVLYGLGQSGRLYTLDTASGLARPVGFPDAVPARPAVLHGFDFNPVADRVRVVTAAGDNLRLHPDTGAVVDFDAAREGWQPDPALAYVAGDPNAARAPELVAAAYTYNTQNDKLTTNYAIDRALGTLVLQGSREGGQPVVSPNLGRLSTVGLLGLGPLADASFDISDVGNLALAAVRRAGSAPTETLLVQIDLTTGAARTLGRLGDGAPVQGLAIEP
jgi:hypothetical protein